MISRVRGVLLSIVGRLWLRVGGGGVVLRIAVVVCLHSGLHRWGQGKEGSGRLAAGCSLGYRLRGGRLGSMQRAAPGGERGRSWAGPGYREARGDLAVASTRTRVAALLPV